MKRRNENQDYLFLTRFGRISVSYLFSVLIQCEVGMGLSNSDGEGIRRRSCGCGKEDFLPEESFQSWGNYANALKATPSRLMDRLMTRSAEKTELVEMKARSEHEMKKNLTWWDLIWFGVGAVIGAGIFVLTGLETKEHAGPAVVLSYVVSGVSALLSVFCYTEFAVEIPAAGTLFLSHLTPPKAFISLILFRSSKISLIHE